MKSRVSHSMQETEHIATEWLNELATAFAEQKRSGAMIVGLSGHLGAGKTAFVKAVAKNLGITEEVTSPTFVIMKSYDISSASVAWKRLVHIDAYRLEGSSELKALHFEDLIADQDNFIMIEWPERVGEEKNRLLQRIILKSKGNTHVVQFSA